MDDDAPTTPAIEALTHAGVPFRVVRTEIARSAEESAAFQSIELGALLRSILVRKAADDYLFVLVPGGRRFDWPKLRAHLGTSRLSLPDADEARAITGYERGAITPFGALRAWPVIADASIEAREVVAIGG
ncbi:MAG TPA: YbaK/EbsC family protein, partial [Candidatus Limnocylindrales bacterium]